MRDLPIGHRRYLAALGRTQNTQVSYTRDIEEFLDYLSEIGIDDLNKTDTQIFNAYIDWLRDKGNSPNSICRKMSALKSFYRYLGQERVVDIDPTSIPSGPGTQKQPPSSLRDRQIDRMLAVLDPSTPLGLRDIAIITLIYLTGLHVSEVVALNLGDIDFVSMQINVRGARHKQRTIPMGEILASVLKLYLSRAHPELEGPLGSDALFLNAHGNRITRQGINLRLIHCAREARIHLRVTPEGIRQTFAVEVLNQDIDPKSVQRILGHADPATTRRYVPDNRGPRGLFVRQYRPEGGSLPGFDWDKVDSVALRRLYWDDGMSTPEIARAFDVEQTEVWKRMKNLGIPLRPPGRPWREREGPRRTD